LHPFAILFGCGFAAVKRGVLEKLGFAGKIHVSLAEDLVKCVRGRLEEKRRQNEGNRCQKTQRTP
jgi:hypothetical protein